MKLAVTLISHKPEPDGKWSFTFDNGKTIVLKETWEEVLLGAPIEQVRAWFNREFGWALYFLGLL